MLAPMGKDNVSEQELPDGQLLPGALTVAVLTTLPLSGPVGVTGIVKLTLAPGASPAATVHVTVWPTALQPLGIAPSWRVAGITSVIVAVVVSADAPVLVTASV